MSAHTIQLGNAWDRDADAGHAWRRRFGRPAGLVDGDRVFLVIERPAVSSSPAVNGHGLAPVAAGSVRWTCDVTALLGDRNDLVLVTIDPGTAAAASPAGAPAGRMPLPAALGGVRLAIVPRGEAADAATMPLPPPRRA